MKVCWVKIWIDSMATLTERFRDDEGRVDFEALGREEYAFRHALITSDYSKSERARDLAEAAEKDYKIHSENGKKGGRPKKLTAAAATREGVDESTTCCKHYDQETQISANSPAGAGVNIDSTHTISPDDSVGNAGEVVPHGSTKGSRVTGTSGTSGQTISKKETLDTAEALDNTCEGGTPGIERESASLPSHTPVKTDPKPTRKAKAEVKPEEQKYPHGEFENIMLTTREYTQLCERLDNADSLIDEADGYFEAQPDKKRKYKSHYAMLLNWDRRRKEFEGVKPRKFKTAVDQDREEIKWLSDYYAKKERGENPPLPKIKMVGSA